MNRPWEERVTGTLEEELSRVDAERGDLAAVMRQGARLRTRRRLVVGAAAAAVVVATGVALVVGDRSDDVEPAPTPTTGGTWTEVSPAPLSPRHSPQAVWTGEEVLVVGGGAEPPCPPNAGCREADEYTATGAAYDPDTDTWRPISDAPVDVGPGANLFAVDDLVVLFAGLGYEPERWFAYAPAADRWRDLPATPRRVAALGGVSDGEVWVLDRRGDVRALDPVAGRWRTLPRSDQRPVLDPVGVVATPEGIFVSGVDSRVGDDGDTPSFVTVERWDGERWTRYPETGQIGGYWHWTGERLVAVDPQVATGLDGLPPYGGVLEVDDGTWSPLPNAPDLETYDVGDSWSVNAAEGPVVAGWGSYYDDRTGVWTPQGRPDGTTVDGSQAAVWAAGRLVVFGGLDEETGYESVDGLSRETWVWTSR